MIEIEEPPDIRACTDSMTPLVWLYSARTSHWVPFCTEPLDTAVLRLHRCRRHGDPPPTWREIQARDPETVRAGAARVRAELRGKGLAS